MELSVAVMLVLLGLWNVLSFRRAAIRLRTSPEAAEPKVRYGRLRSLLVGTVHGLAGSAALGLLVLTTIRTPGWALVYLLLFGLGTIVGMMLITSAMALPIVYTVRKVSSWNGHIGWITGLFSLALGLFLTYQIGFVDGLFRAELPFTR
jgi:high-affinity nickel-transport protein